MILADAHVHIYNCFDMTVFLNAAVLNFCGEASLIEDGDEFSQTDVDRTPWNFNSAWDEPHRLPPRNRQCGICAGNMKPRGDSWICRECGEEEIDPW